MTETFNAGVSVNTAKRREQEAITESLHNKTFGGWVNHQLSRKGYPKIQNLLVDFKDGVHFIHLLESIYNKPVDKKYNVSPTTEIQRIENVAIALELLQEHNVSLSVNSKDIESGNRKLTLGLVFRLIMEHQMLKSTDITSETTISQRNKAAKSNLIEFCKKQTEGVKEVQIVDLVESFSDGKAFLAMLHNMNNNLFNDWNKINELSVLDRFKLAFETAEKEFGIPQLLDPLDLVNPDPFARPDEKCLMTYISEFPLALIHAQEEAQKRKEEEIEAQLSKEKQLEKELEAKRLKEKEEQDLLLKNKEEESEKMRLENLKLKEVHTNMKVQSVLKKEEIISGNETIKEENERIKEEINRLKQEIQKLNEEVKMTKAVLIGQLNVTVKEARNVPGLDLTGKSDPYLKLKLEEQEFKTKVKKRNLNPKWDQSFDFFVTDRNAELFCTLWDWDRFSKDDFIGQFFINLSQLKDGKSEAKWFPLQGAREGDKVSGEVLLVLSFKLGK